jgi:hypothetical protein
MRTDFLGVGKILGVAEKRSGELVNVSGFPAAPSSRAV